jgi:hypothetical protein
MIPGSLSLGAQAKYGIGFLQCGRLEPGRSLVEQAADPHGLLNPGKRA